MPIIVDSKPRLGDYVVRGAGLSSRYALYGTEQGSADVTVPIVTWFRFVESAEAALLAFKQFPKSAVSSESESSYNRLLSSLTEAKQKAFIDAAGVVLDRSLASELQDAIDHADFVIRSSDGRSRSSVDMASDRANEDLTRTIDVATGGKGPKPMALPPNVMSSREALRRMVSGMELRGHMPADLPVSTPVRNSGTDANGLNVGPIAGLSADVGLPESQPVAVSSPPPGVNFPSSDSQKIPWKWIAGAAALLALI